MFCLLKYLSVIYMEIGITFPFCFVNWKVCLQVAVKQYMYVDIGIVL